MSPIGMHSNQEKRTAANAPAMLKFRSSTWFIVLAICFAIFTVSGRVLGVCLFFKRTLADGLQFQNNFIYSVVCLSMVSGAERP